MISISNDLRRYAELAESIENGITECMKSLNSHYHLAYRGCVQWSIDTENETEKFKEQMSLKDSAEAVA